MRFENQVSLYDTDAIINKFNTQDTQLRVVQGEIDLIISESEREELISGASTMYSQLASVKVDVSGLTGQFSTLSTGLDTLTGQYTALDSKVATYKASVDGLSSNVTSISTTLARDYSTTEAMHAYADGVGTNAINTAATDATTKANSARDAAIADTTQRLSSYATISLMESYIAQSESEITASVSSKEYVNRTASAPNLILNSRFMRGTEYWEVFDEENPPDAMAVATSGSIPYLHISSSSANGGAKQVRDGDGIRVAPGARYSLILSCYAASASLKNSFRIRLYVGDAYSELTYTNIGNTVSQIAKFVTFPSAQVNDKLTVAILPYDSSGMDIYVTELCLRRGEIGVSDAAPWVPAPEDSLNGEISDLSARMSAAELKITDSAIVSTVTNSEGFSSAIEQHANSIRLQATKLSWDSYYSSMTENGYLRCQFADVSGTITGSEIKSSTITGNTISGGTISGATINGNTITGGTITGTTIYGVSIMSQGLTSSELHNTYIRDSTADYSTLRNGTVEGCSISGSDITGGHCSPSSFDCGSVDCDSIVTGAFTCGSSSNVQITSGSIEINSSSGRELSSMTGYSLEIGSAYSGGGLHDASVFYVDGSYLSCSGEKNRIVATQDYGTRALVCYEMPSPMFGDIGTGRTDEDGICYIDFNPIWCETVDLDGEYYVFLQEEGEGKLYVTEKTAVGFYVKGTPNLRFSWEAKAYQYDGRGKYLVDASTRQTNSEVIE